MQVKTINLTGEAKVEFDRNYYFVEINNLSGNEILVSTNAGIVRGNDDVIILPSKAIVTIGETGSPGINEIYVFGSGEIQLIAKNYAEHCFKRPASGDNSDDPTADVLKFLPHPEGIFAYWDFEHGIENTTWTDMVNGRVITCNEGGSFLVSDEVIKIVGYDGNTVGASLGLDNYDLYTLYLVVGMQDSQNHEITDQNKFYVGINEYNTTTQHEIRDLSCSAQTYPHYRMRYNNSASNDYVTVLNALPRSSIAMVKTLRSVSLCSGASFETKNTTNDLTTNKEFGIGGEVSIKALLLSTETNNIDNIQANLQALHEKYYPEVN